MLISLSISSSFMEAMGIPVQFDTTCSMSSTLTRSGPSLAVSSSRSARKRSRRSRSRFMRSRKCGRLFELLIGNRRVQPCGELA